MKEIVIKIPEDEYNIAKYGQYGNINVDIVRKALANGTPLPEYHGRIIDESKINTVYTHTETNINNDIKCIRTKITRTDAPTIIEAEWSGAKREVEE